MMMPEPPVLMRQSAGGQSPRKRKATAFKLKRVALPLIMTITSKFGKWRARIQSDDDDTTYNVSFTSFSKWTVRSSCAGDAAFLTSMTLASSIMAYLKDKEKEDLFMDGPCTMDIECVMGTDSCNIGSTSWPDYREYSNNDLASYIESKLVFIGKVFNN